MKKFLIFFVTLVMSLTVNAESAKSILDKTAALVGRKGGAQASFTINGGKIGKQSGTIYLKGNKFCAKTPAATMWYNGKTQWTYMKSTNEVNVSNPNASKQSAMNPYSFIKLYKKGYNLTNKKVGGNNQVHMTATNAKASIQEVYVTVDKNYSPTQIRMRQGANNWTTIVITNFQAKNQADAMFSFNAKDYPKAEVVDLR